MSHDIERVEEVTQDLSTDTQHTVNQVERFDLIPNNSPMERLTPFQKLERGIPVKISFHDKGDWLD